MEPKKQKWKSLSDLGMSHHTSNRQCRDIIRASIPWRLDEYDSHIQVGDWIGSPTPGTGNPLDRVYLVLEHTQDKASVIEFKKITPNSRIQAMTQQALTISTANYRTVKVLSQKKPGATLKMARDPPTPGKKPPMYWIFETGFIQDLPWDPGEWHWRTNPPLGDAPFFGYTSKKGYINTRRTTHSSNMLTFLHGLNLRNTTNTQMIARLWHNVRPRKVGTLIWLTLNQGLPVGTWLQLMGISLTCKVCDSNAEESPKHCLLECSMAQRAWNAYKRIWDEWQVPHDIVITWPFALLGEATIEHEDDPPGLLGYHTSGFTYPRQPLDILRSFILYHLWSERCRKHFGEHYSLKKVFTQAWVATVEVSMATWKTIRSHRPTKDHVIQTSIELDFRKEWLHMNILRKDNATIGWHFLPPLYYLHFAND
jgi:hypothetical protein